MPITITSVASCRTTAVEKLDGYCGCSLTGHFCTCVCRGAVGQTVSHVKKKKKLSALKSSRSSGPCSLPIHTIISTSYDMVTDCRKKGLRGIEIVCFPLYTSPPSPLGGSGRLDTAVPLEDECFPFSPGELSAAPVGHRPQ